MRRVYFKTAAAAVVLGLSMTSCGNSEPEDDTLNVVDTTQEDVLTEDMFESPDVDYHLPSPLQVASIFKKSGLAYHSNITNPTGNVSKYTEELKQMLNFGVYSADMAYCVLNEQANEGRKYLSVITQLAEEIGMEAVFTNQDLMDRFDKNIENKDSIEILMIDIHERTETYMEENDMQHKSAIQFAGAWTEGMYLGVYDFEKNKNKDGLGSQITEQMSILNNIIKGLNDPKNSGTDLGWLISDLENIQSTFDNFESVKAYTADENATELELTDGDFKALGDLIKALRAKIINA